jgi:hypothetical protein
MAGGLVSYETSITDAYLLDGSTPLALAKGEKPADSPVQQSTNLNS